MVVGYVFGYFGGGLFFVVNLVFYFKFEIFGLVDVGVVICVGFVLMVIWWFVFVLLVLCKVFELFVEDVFLMVGFGEVFC